MKYRLNDWPNYHFDYWKEYGPSYAGFPRATDFVDPKRVNTYDLKRLCQYLESGTLVSLTSRISYPSPFTGEKLHGSFMILTDGEWLYSSELSQYILKNSMAIPDKWYKKIESQNFEMRAVSASELEKIIIHGYDDVINLFS